MVNIGLGEALTNGRAMEAATRDLTTITGQKPIITRARKSIAGFKLRAGNPIGTCVTLRGARMYHFLDRLINTALPRIRDFRGISRRGFDGRGNFSIGLREQIIFPEIDYNQIDRFRGCRSPLSPRRERCRIYPTAGNVRNALCAGRLTSDAKQLIEEIPWQRSQWSKSGCGNPNIPCASTTGATGAAGPGLTSDILESAAFASGRWPSPENYRVSERLLVTAGRGDSQRYCSIQEINGLCRLQTQSLICLPGFVTGFILATNRFWCHTQN